MEDEIRETIKQILNNLPISAMPMVWDTVIGESADQILSLRCGRSTLAELINFAEKAQELGGSLGIIYDGPCIDPSYCRRQMITLMPSEKGRK